MKKNWLYIILGTILLIAIFLIISSRANRAPKKRELDERISFRNRDKIPYGTYVAYNTIGSAFKGAVVSETKKAPGFWENLSAYETGQALIIVSPKFDPDEYELQRLQEFVEAGNDVLISSMNWSYTAQQFFNVSIQSSNNFFDTLAVRLKLEDNYTAGNYGYPGNGMKASITDHSENYATVLGYDYNGSINTLRMTVGKGKFILHSSPMAFTNYFLISNNNYEYYQRLLSTISPGINKVVWDQYYLDASSKDEKKGWLRTLMTLENEEGKRSFGTAIYILLALLLLFTLLEMRRKQREIPLRKAPSNDSLDFVKTIGRLYHEKGDHGNLGRKMSAYFLEHVRNRYQLPTVNLDDAFVRALHSKSGAELDLVNSIVKDIHVIDTAAGISVDSLTLFHKKLESFYKTA